MLKIDILNEKAGKWWKIIRRNRNPENSTDYCLAV